MQHSLSLHLRERPAPPPSLLTRMCVSWKQRAPRSPVFGTPWMPVFSDLLLSFFTLGGVSASSHSGFPLSRPQWCCHQLHVPAGMGDETGPGCLGHKPKRLLAWLGSGEGSCSRGERRGWLCVPRACQVWTSGEGPFRGGRGSRAGEGG